MELLVALIQFLGAVAALVTALVAPFLLFIGRAAAREAKAAAVAATEATKEAKAAVVATSETKAEVAVIGKTIDGRMHELLAAREENAGMKATKVEKDAQAGREADAVGDALTLQRAVADAMQKEKGKS